MLHATVRVLVCAYTTITLKSWHFDEGGGSSFVRNAPGLDIQLALIFTACHGQDSNNCQGLLIITSVQFGSIMENIFA